MIFIFKYFQRYNTCLFDEKTAHLKLILLARKESMACSQPEVALTSSVFSSTGSVLLCQVLELQH